MADQHPAMAMANELASIARARGLRASAHVGMQMPPRPAPAVPLQPETVNGRLIRHPHALILLERRRADMLHEAARAEHISAAHRTLHWLATAPIFDDRASDGVMPLSHITAEQHAAEKARAEDILAVLLGDF